MLEDIRGMAEVAYVERNQEVTAVACFDQTDAEWGLVRTTYKDNWSPDDKDYSYSTEFRKYGRNLHHYNCSPFRLSHYEELDAP